jgi:hypothetical protein
MGSAEAELVNWEFEAGRSVLDFKTYNVYVMYCCMNSKSFVDLVAWQTADELVLSVYRLTQHSQRRS